MVIPPLVGAEPIARKRVTRRVGAAIVPKVLVATCTQVNPFPFTLGMLGGFVPVVLRTSSRIKALAAGVTEAVVTRLPVVTTPEVRLVALRVAVAVRLLGATGGLDGDAELRMVEATEGTPLEFTMNSI